MTIGTGRKPFRSSSHDDASNMPSAGSMKRSSADADALALAPSRQATKSGGKARRFRTMASKTGERTATSGIGRSHARYSASRRRTSAPSPCEAWCRELQGSRRALATRCWCSADKKRRIPMLRVLFRPGAVLLTSAVLSLSFLPTAHAQTEQQNLVNRAQSTLDNFLRDPEMTWLQ